MAAFGVATEDQAKERDTFKPIGGGRASFKRSERHSLHKPVSLSRLKALDSVCLIYPDHPFINYRAHAHLEGYGGRPKNTRRSSVLLAGGEKNDGVGEKRSHSGDESKAMPVVAQ